MIPPIDWSKFTEPPTTTCYCRCGTRYRSHCKSARVEGLWRLVSQKPCPGCGKTNDCYRASTDPESFTIRG